MCQWVWQWCQWWMKRIILTSISRTLCLAWNWGNILQDLKELKTISCLLTFDHNIIMKSRTVSAVLEENRVWLAMTTQVLTYDKPTMLEPLVLYSIHCSFESNPCKREVFENNVDRDFHRRKSKHHKNRNTRAKAWMSEGQICSVTVLLVALEAWDVWHNERRAGNSRFSWYVINRTS